MGSGADFRELSKLDNFGVKTFIVNGKPRSGKDTFVDYASALLKLHHIKSKSISSVDKVKAAAELLGWNGVKDEKGRKFLSDLKDISSSVYDGPLEYMRSEILDFNHYNSNGVVFIMIREPEEIIKFVSKFPHTKTIYVNRGVTESFNNHADENVEKYYYDYIIDNEGDLLGLQKVASDFVFTLLTSSEVDCCIASDFVFP